MTTILGLVKILETEDYSGRFIAGNLSLNRLPYFKGIEEARTITRKDKHEGVVQWLQSQHIQLEINGHDFTDDLAGPLSVQMNWLDHIHVLCVTALHSADLNLKQLCPDNMPLLKQQLEIDSACSAFGQYAIAVTNVTEFFKRFEAAVKRRNLKMCRGLVRYYDPETFHGGWDGVESIFWKRNEYQYQKEYRFAVDTGTLGSDPMILDIGALEDITACVPTTKFNSLLRIHTSVGADQ